MGNDHTDKLVLLLTACINPGKVPSVARRDPATRLNDYQQALRRFLRCRDIKNIVFCENSGADLNGIWEVARINNLRQVNLEVLSFVGHANHPEYGKGYGEMRIINHALSNSDTMRHARMIMKVTGRILLANADAIATGVSRISGVDVFCDLRKNLSTADSRVFCASPRFLTEYFLPLQGIMNEAKGVCFEDVLARAVHRAMADGLRWAMLPRAHDMRGIAATTDRQIPSSRLSFVAREVFRIFKVLVLGR